MYGENQEGGRESRGSLPLPWGQQREEEKIKVKQRLAQVRQKRWQSSGGEEHHVIRDLYHVPGLPHGYDPPLFQKRIEQPLGTSADATEPVELQHPLALARPVLRRAGQLPGLRRGGSEVRSSLCLLYALCFDFPLALLPKTDRSIWKLVSAM